MKEGIWFRPYAFFLLFDLFLFIYYNKGTIYKEGINEEKNFIITSNFNFGNTYASSSC